jgi:hypothetical protein
LDGFKVLGFYVKFGYIESIHNMRKPVISIGISFTPPDSGLAKIEIERV